MVSPGGCYSCRFDCDVKPIAFAKDAEGQHSGAGVFGRDSIHLRLRQILIYFAKELMRFSGSQSKLGDPAEWNINGA